MTAELVSAEVKRFLASDRPEVLCITGQWGVGKTYTWQRLLSEDQKAGKVRLARYAYVSLFGLNSLEELKQAVFENTIALTDLKRGPSLDTLTRALEQGARKGFGFARNLPLVQSYVGNAGGAVFLMVRKQIVCIDDFERSGAELRARDVLGLISLLREQRECKVVLLLNSGQLQGAEKEEFDSQLEKVADSIIDFRPTPTEAAAIGVTDGDQMTPWLRESVVKLGIVNIRIIKRIEENCQRLRERLRNYDEAVLKQAVKSTSLFVWSKFQPTDAPPLEFIARFNQFQFQMGRPARNGQAVAQGVPAPDEDWAALLGAYDYALTDDFDRVILEGVSLGYFDPAALKNAAHAVQEQIRRAHLDNSMTEAWDLFHGSFEDNENEVVAAMENAVRRSAEFLSTTNLNSAIQVLKRLGRGPQATDLIAHYAHVHAANREIIDLENAPFGDQVTDPEIRAALRAQLDVLFVPRPALEVLMKMARTNGWDEDDIRQLARAEVEDFRRAFMAARGNDRKLIVAAAYQFRRLGGATDEMLEISRKAHEAVVVIGRTSRLNAMRVRSYGVEIDDRLADQR